MVAIVVVVEAVVVLELLVASGTLEHRRGVIALKVLGQLRSRMVKAKLANESLKVYYHSQLPRLKGSSTPKHQTTAQKNTVRFGHVNVQLG